MPLARNFDLHGSVPDSADTALVVLDVLSDYKFPGGTSLCAQMERVAPKLARFQDGLRKKKIPIIYANDNAGKWRSSRESIQQHALGRESRGRKIAQLLMPTDDDYFVIKPKHSAFFGTGLDLLLQYLGVKNLILAGMAGDNCVYFTASDAYLRDFQVYVPTDCIASIDPNENRDAVRRMRKILKVKAAPGAKLLRDSSLIPRARADKSSP